jgi:hypothetical protein
MKDKDTSRRDFLVTGVLAGLAMGCNSKKNPFENYAGTGVKPSGETIKCYR